jgi:hypothetical protein
VRVTIPSALRPTLGAQMSEKFANWACDLVPIYNKAYVWIHVRPRNLMCRRERTCWRLACKCRIPDPVLAPSCWRVQIYAKAKDAVLAGRLAL